eukprot:4737273-Prymnesium_polylepis.2
MFRLGAAHNPPSTHAKFPNNQRNGQNKKRSNVSRDRDAVTCVKSRHTTLNTNLLLSECQPHVGDFLNALPHSRDTVFPPSTLRYAIQRRLHLRLDPPPPAPPRTSWGPVR